MFFDIFLMFLTLFSLPEQSDLGTSGTEIDTPSNDDHGAPLFGRGLNHNETLVADLDG